GAEFRGDLPVACRDGTLKDRFCGTAAAGRVSAKTGTLSGVVVLVGYTATASNRAVRFAFMISGASSTTQARAAVDRAVVQIAAFAG
ncbi:MAG: D-alanyl-D-alanine carboxypeptidase, partial [Frankia sp.]|nr:D-alanyl-D-alanine carboxypeptidase [Frankia sp.]